MAPGSLHEETGTLSEETRNYHRVIVSLIEELEAVDWYNQRADAAQDGQLREYLFSKGSVAASGSRFQRGERDRRRG